MYGREEETGRAQQVRWKKDFFFLQICIAKEAKENFVANTPDQTPNCEKKGENGSKSEVGHVWSGSEIL